MRMTRVAAVLETLGLSLIVSPAHERPGLTETTVSSALEQHSPPKVCSLRTDDKRARSRLRSRRE